MTAASRDKKTLAYQLGEALSQMTDHYLLMTAMPHKGDPDNFCLFLQLLDGDVYGDVKSLEEAMRKQEARFYLRRIKEALVTFPEVGKFPACKADSKDSHGQEYSGETTKSAFDSWASQKKWENFLIASS